MVVGSRRRDMVCGFFGKYGGELGVFGGKDGFGLCRFSGCGEFSGGSEAGDNRGAHRNKTGTAPYDSVEGSVFASSINVRGFFLPLVVLKEARICDGVHVYVARGASGGFKERVVSFVVDLVGGEEEFGFVNRFVEGEGSGGPVNGGVSGS